MGTHTHTHPLWYADGEGAVHGAVTGGHCGSHMSSMLFFIMLECWIHRELGKKENDDVSVTMELRTVGQRRESQHKKKNMHINEKISE